MDEIPTELTNLNLSVDVDVSSVCSIIGIPTYVAVPRLSCSLCKDCFPPDPR